MGNAGERRNGLADHAGITEYWRFRDKFAKVLDPRYYPLEWLDVQIATGKMVLFTTSNSAILASIRTYPSGLKELHGELAAGNLETVVSQLIPQAEAYGRLHGCEIAVIQSREGWAKVMKASGYSLHQTSLRKAL